MAHIRETAAIKVADKYGSASFSLILADTFDVRCFATDGRDDRAILIVQAGGTSVNFHGSFDALSAMVGGLQSVLSRAYDVHVAAASES